MYVDRGIRDWIKERARRTPQDPQAGRLFDLSNILDPGPPIQDFTHQREWRVFGDIDLTATPPEFVICPVDFVEQVRKLFPRAQTILPLDTLFQWGA